MAGFTYSGSLLTPRGAFGATRLDDARGLVAGGLRADGSGVLDTEMYDQATG